jgi:hypothetical protein
VQENLSRVVWKRLSELEGNEKYWTGGGDRKISLYGNDNEPTMYDMG